MSVQLSASLLRELRSKNSPDNPLKGLCIKVKEPNKEPPKEVRQPPNEEKYCCPTCGNQIDDSLRKLADVVSFKHGLTIKNLRGASRTKRISRCRQEFMWRAHHETGRSLCAIGRFLRRDHTTVLHGVRKHQAAVDAAQATYDLLLAEKANA